MRLHECGEVPYALDLQHHAEVESNVQKQSKNKAYCYKWHHDANCSDAYETEPKGNQSYFLKFDLAITLLLCQAYTASSRLRCEQ